MSKEDLILSFASQLIAGLQKTATVTPTRWALENVREPSGTRFSFRKFPWQREMMDSTSPHNVAVKGAQLGISHAVLLRAICANDLEKRDALYIMPNMNPLGSNFSTSRFDVIVAASPHLASIYDRSNVGHKRTVTNNLYIRGAQSKASGKSVPAGFLVVDEIDEVPDWFIPLVRERMSGQDVKTEWDISTPTAPEFGISKLWDESSQDLFMFPCPHCSTSAPGTPSSGRLIQLSYPECLEVVGDDPDSVKLLTESFIKCPECHQRLDHATKPDWLARAKFYSTVHGKSMRGFYVNQLYSSTVSPGEFAAASVRAQFSEIHAQEFYNSKLGKAHAPDGAKIREDQVNACRGDHGNFDEPDDSYTLRTMGVDVGSRIHFEVDEWLISDNVNQGNDPNSHAAPKVLRASWCRHFEELDELMALFRINMCVVDAMPETRMAFQFSQRWSGRVKMCYYAQGVVGKMLVEAKWDQGEPIINVNRTSWMDQSLFRFKPGPNGTRNILLPKDVPHEYVQHLMTPVRLWTRDKSGNPMASWKTPDKHADHHAHARNYAEIALPLALGLGVHQNIESPYE